MTTLESHTVYSRNIEIVTFPVKSLLVGSGLAAVTLLCIGIINLSYTPALISIQATHVILTSGGILFTTTTLALTILLMQRNGKHSQLFAELNTELENTKKALVEANENLAEAQASEAEAYIVGMRVLNQSMALGEELIALHKQAHAVNH